MHVDTEESIDLTRLIRALNPMSGKALDLKYIGENAQNLFRIHGEQEK